MAKRDDYTQVDHGEMVEMVPETPVVFACCDCGLMHCIEVSKSVTLRWSLETLRTKNYRRKYRKELKFRKGK